MKRITVYLTAIISIALMTLPAQAKSKSSKRARVQANVEAPKTKGKWIRDKFSTLQSNGLSIADASTCERFEIEVLEKNLIYKIRCGTHYSSGLVPLADEQDYKVDKKTGEILITKLNYYGQKVQTSNVGQSVVKMPFVEEVTFIKFLSDGSLTFYKENFSVDDFGRVVQKSFLQGYGLSNAETKKVGSR